MKYLTLSKSGTWYFRYQVPFLYRSLFDNRTEIKRSLRTSDKKEATLLSLKLEMDIRQRIMNRSTKPFSDKVANQLIEANARVVKMKINNALEPMSLHARERLASLMNDIKALKLQNSYSSKELNTLINLSEDIFDTSRTIEQQVAAELSRIEYDISKSSLLILQTKQALTNIFLIAEQARISMLKMNIDDCHDRISQLNKILDEENNQKERLKPSNQITIEPAKSQNTSPKTTFKQLLEQYITERKLIVTPPTLEATNKKASLISEFIGKKDLQSISRSDAIQVRDLLLSWPSNVNKVQEFKGLTYKKVIKKNLDLGKPCLSESTVKDYLEKTSSIFKWAVKNQLTTFNPFESIPVISKTKKKKKSQLRHAYTEQHLKQIFTTPIHTECEMRHPYYYWLPLLALFSGARLNELAQLHCTDIQKHDNIWCLSFSDALDDQRLKNDSARRLVPIHSRLIELGFIDFVASNDERVFPELPYTEKNGFGGNASKWFGRFKSNLGFDKGHDFHSFRHTVINYFKQDTTVEDRFVQGIVGHENGSITFDRYGKDFRPSVLQPYIELLEWDLDQICTFGKKR
ncbi:site-specific integrase [Vibrio europaeus]|uniref:site-specific integrase n=2 Tax=Vibrio TaxID=662 RepID=UPI00233EBD25|nr:site-specific integrase [Vibrio europaeus]MDC5803773.1 site-specific integrase [Vibrio europaeus]MDC5823646.1 site-specific integrase [Vibrio europaeus]MDC5828518.1 site-specific integrase [Vibrio europaeus]MDC5833378.1 site-specific integrase [Vibrio europaeus]